MCTWRCNWVSCHPLRVFGVLLKHQLVKYSVSKWVLKSSLKSFDTNTIFTVTRQSYYFCFYCITKGCRLVYCILLFTAYPFLFFLQRLKLHGYHLTFRWLKVLKCRAKFGFRFLRKLLCFSSDPMIYCIGTPRKGILCIQRKHIKCPRIRFGVRKCVLLQYMEGSNPRKWVVTWWRHQMEIFSSLLDFCAENSPVAGEFPAQRPVTRSFDVFLILKKPSGVNIENKIFV